MINKDNILNLEDNFLISKENFSDTMMMMMLNDDEEQLNCYKNIDNMHICSQSKGK
jgi:hypothetical protein